MMMMNGVILRAAHRLNAASQVWDKCLASTCMLIFTQARIAESSVKDTQ